MNKRTILYFAPNSVSGQPMLSEESVTTIPQWLGTAGVTSVVVTFASGCESRYELEPEPVRYTVEWRTPKQGERYLYGNSIITAECNHTRPCGVIVEESK